MKGYFTIASDYGTGELSFGKLGFEKGGLGYIQDIYGETRIGQLIAHDVVEHSAAHRTKTYVAYEDEIRAAGAISFIRSDCCFDMYEEVMIQIANLARPIKPIPKIMMKYLYENHYIETEMMRGFIEDGVEVADARNACYQYALGRYQKEIQCGFDYYTGRYAFNFIEQNVIAALQDMYDEESSYVSGVTIYFDTVKQIFRWTFKRQ